MTQRTKPVYQDHADFQQSMQAAGDASRGVEPPERNPFIVGVFVVVVWFIIVQACTFAYSQAPAPRLVGVQHKYDDSGWTATRGGDKAAQDSLTIGTAKYKQASAGGQLPVVVNNALAAAVRVRFPTGNGAFLGSGVHIGDGLYITAAHVGRGASPNATVTFPDGKTDACLVVGKDETYDLLLLQGTVGANAPWVQLHDKNLTIGETVYLAGYARGKLEAWFGPVVEFSGPMGGSQDWIDARGGASSGDSGGPVLTGDGKLCAVLWGSSGGGTRASNTGRLRTFLLPWQERITEWTEAQCYGPYCPPGQPQQGGGNIGGDANRITPVPPSATPPATPPVPPQPTPPSGKGCDCEKLAETIAEAITKNSKPGPAGKDGIDGLDGLPGADGKDGIVTEEHLAMVIDSIYTRLKDDPELKGPKGDTGAAGKDAAVDMDALVAAVIEKLPPIPVQNYDRNNRLIKTEHYPYGTPIKIRYGLVE